jgi:hypothetical protein
VSHWFCNIIGFGVRALPAPVAELVFVERCQPFARQNLRAIGAADQYLARTERERFGVSR